MSIFAAGDNAKGHCQAFDGFPENLEPPTKEHPLELGITGKVAVVTGGASGIGAATGEVAA